MSEKMIVACPQCQTRFVAPLEKFLPDGRKVRCAKCSHAWFQAPERPESIAAQPDPVAPASPVEATPPAGETTADPAEAPVVPVAPVPPPVRSSESLMDRAARKAEAVPVADLAAKNRVDSEETARTFGASETAAAVAAAAAGTATDASAASASASDMATGQTDTGRYTPAPATTSRDDGAGSDVESGGGGAVRKVLYLLAATVIVGALGYAFKDAIAAKVPALDPPLTTWKSTVDGALSKVIPSSEPLVIQDVKYDLEDGDEAALLLTATVINTGKTPVDAPKLAVSIIGPEDEVLETQSLSPEDLIETIAPGTGAPYYLRMPFPPEALERVEVDFAE